MTGGHAINPVTDSAYQQMPVGERAGGPAAGFVGEMRAVAMKLHTKEQAPKEGGIEAPKPAVVGGWISWAAA